MIANYHTHTPRCNHAKGTEEEYVSHALKRGLQILGFSDHTPQFFDGDYYSWFRMKREQLTDYCATVNALKSRYAGQLEIHLGVEAEFYPRHFRELHSFLTDHGIEYMILGQHFTKNETDGCYSGNVTDDPDILKQYCHQAMDAMQTGYFTYFAHPDLIHFTGAESLYRQHMAEVFREARSCSIPLEINLLGLTEGRHYPSSAFLEIAAEEGCPMIIGVDAHSPSALSDENPERIARSMAADYGLKILDRADLHKL